MPRNSAFFESSSHLRPAPTQRSAGGAPSHYLNSRALGRLIDRHLGALYRFAFVLTGQVEHASGMVAEAFARANVDCSIDDGLNDERLRLLAAVYARYLEGSVSRTTASPGPACEQCEHDEPDVADLDLAAIDGARVVAALQRVEPALRVPLALFFLERVTCQQISEILGLPLTVVMQRLARGKALLYRALGDRAQANAVAVRPPAQEELVR
jgi:DNA-directed RNA polymerase specialized sigma24 family protein